MLSVGVLIASAVSLGLVRTTLPSFDLGSLGINGVILLFNSLSAGGVGVGVAVLIIVWEIVMIILRFLNIGSINLKIWILLVIVSNNNYCIGRIFERIKFRGFLAYQRK